jgi:type IV secretion system protein VirD4
MARFAFLLGLVLAAVLASSVVAWKFGYAPELGRPLWGHFYHPLDIIAWGRSWGLENGYRGRFLAGLSLALVAVAVPLALVRLIDLYGPLRVDARSKDQGLGSVAELQGTRHISQRGDGVVLGRAGRKVLRDHGDGHVLIMGPARSGKGTGHVIPTLLGHAGSMLVFDPKHELAAITGRRRGSFGPVHIFNPTDERSARFNPLLELRQDGHLIGDCQMAAHMLTHLGHGSREDPFWEDAAASLLAAILIHVCCSEERSLAHVWRVVQDIKADLLPSATHPEARRTFVGHEALEGRVRSSINETLNVRLSFLADPIIQAVTAASDFRAGDLQAADHPVTVFLSIPVAHGNRLRPLTRLMLQSLIAPLTHDLHLTSDGRMKQRGVLALLDEFPQLGRMDVLADGIAVCAGYGVRVAMVCQDEDQIRACYGAHQSITANCSTICSIPGFSGQSLQTVARWGGEQAVAHAGRQRAQSLRGTSSSQSESEARIPVLNPREMLLRGREEVLVFTLGCKPTWLPKAPYHRLRLFRGLYDQHVVAAPAATARPQQHEEERTAWLLQNRRA